MKNSATWKGVKKVPSQLSPLPWHAMPENSGAKGIVGAGAPIIAANGLAIARAWAGNQLINPNHANDNAEYLTHAANAYPEFVDALVNVIVGEYGMRALRGEFQKQGLPDVPAWIIRAVSILNKHGEGVS